MTNHTPPSMLNARASTNRGSLVIFAAMMLPMFLSALLHADQVKVDGFWVPNVQVQSIADGQIVFLTDGGAERRYPLGKLQGMKLDSYPDMAAVYDAIEKKDNEGALRAALRVSGAVREPWLRTHANWLKAVFYDATGKPVEAAVAYLELVNAKADAWYLTNVSFPSLAKASDGQKRDLAARFNRALGELPADSPVAPVIKQMLELVYVAPAAAAPAAGTAGFGGDAASNGTAPAPAAQPASPAAPAASTPAASVIPGANAGQAISSVVPISRYMEADDDITAMVAKGEFAKALEEINRRLAGNERRMGLRLYQKGICQLYLAEAAQNESQYKDAAISFMRVVIYFSKSSFAGPSLMEAAYAHEKTGQPEIAMRLYQKARLMIDPDSEPELNERLEKLIGGDTAGN